MNAIEFREKLIALFPKYEFTEISEIGSIFGVKTFDTFVWKDSNKTNFKSGNRYMYISGELYPNTDKNFIYAINYTKGVKREYRHKIWQDIELFKDFVSGKTYDELFEEIVKHFYSTSSHGGNNN